MEILELSVHNGIATLTLNRAEKRNSLSSELIRALHDAMETCSANDDVRVVVIKGAGSAFCAGADLAYLQQISELSPTENIADSTALKDMFQSIVQCPKPVIAMVQGPAIAGGCGLATVCDFVIAAKNNAVFGYSEVRIGFIPAIVLVYLVRKIGDTQARRLLLSAETISADEAHRLGMVTTVVDDEHLEAHVTALAEKLAKNSSSAMGLTKHMLNAVQGMSLDAGLQYAAVMNALARQTDDCKRGIDNFLNASKG